MTEYKFTDSPYYSSVKFHEDRDAADHLHQDGHRQRIELAAALVNEVIDYEYLDPSLVTITDYGCGNGGISDLIINGYYLGYDICKANVEQGVSLGRNLLFEDFTEKETLPFSDIVVMCEVLEHMQDPHGFLGKLNCRFLVASVPNGETPEHHPEYHVWGWDNEGFYNMLRSVGFTNIVHYSNSYNTQLWLAS